MLPEGFGVHPVDCSVPRTVPICGEMGIQRDPLCLGPGRGSDCLFWSDTGVDFVSASSKALGHGALLGDLRRQGAAGGVCDLHGWISELRQVAPQELHVRMRRSSRHAVQGGTGANVDACQPCIRAWQPHREAGHSDKFSPECCSGSPRLGEDAVRMLRNLPLVQVPNPRRSRAARAPPQGSPKGVLLGAMLGKSWVGTILHPERVSNSCAIPSIICFPPK